MSSATQFFSGAFSMGKGQRQSLWNKNDTPGPGSYQQQIEKEKHQQTKSQFSKVQRKPLFLDTKTPPPGSYNIPQKTSGPAYTIPNQKSLNQQPSRIGPGSYNTQMNVVKNQVPSYTFQTRFEEVAKDSLRYPGPGTYVSEKQTSKVQRDPTKTSFGNSVRENFQKLDNLQNPGPGSYDIQSSKSVAIKFPQSNRDLNLSNDTPGPGSFDINISQMSRLSSTFALKNYSNLEQTQIIPGPGAYDIPSFIDLKKGAKTLNRIGTSTRQALSQADVLSPSPFDYNIQNTSATKYVKIGTSRRTQITSTMKSPGPGHYSLPTFINTGPNAVIPQSTKDNTKQIDISPGPGNYQVNESQVFQKHPSSVLMGKYDKKVVKTNTGPGKYDLIHDLSKGPKFSFGQDERNKCMDPHQHEPGVGNYEIRGGLGTLPTYLKAKSMQFKVKEII